MRKNLKIWQLDLCNISENAEIGDDVIIHPMVNIYDNVVIGNRVKIQAGVFIPNGIEIGNDCFLGPYCKFLNDKYPPSYHQGWKKIIVKDKVSIGAGAIILPGIIIGSKAIIGAGAVVTKNVDANSTVVGNPAKPIGSD